MKTSILFRIDRLLKRERVQGRTILLSNININIKREFKKGKIRQALFWIVNGHFIRKLKIYNYFIKNGIRLFQIGGGYHSIDGWINGDIIAGNVYCNATKKLPFPDESIDIIFAEQFLEHITFTQGEFFFKECNRILKRGGLIRLSTPDLNGLLNVYYDKNELVTQKDALNRHIQNHNHNCLNACCFLNDFFRLWGHKFIYDRATLKAVLEMANFSLIEWNRFGESKNDLLNNLEQHADVEWMKNAFQLICEAKKI